MKLLDYIRLGIQARDFFLYDDYKITLRPLTSMEFDLCEEAAFEEADDVVAKLVMRIRLGDLHVTKQILDMGPEIHHKLSQYRNTINYWVVFHAMKDFMPDDFSIEDVIKMHSVHEIAQQVFRISSTDTDTIIDEVATPEGEKLATVIYKLHQPLTSELWKLTPLQHKFLVYAHPNSIKKVADSWEEFVKKRAHGEVLRHVGK
jgi:hypothetical protein